MKHSYTKDTWLETRLKDTIELAQRVSMRELITMGNTDLGYASWVITAALYSLEEAGEIKRERHIQSGPENRVDHNPIFLPNKHRS